MSRDLLAVSTIKSNKGGGGKALTMTMTPWNLTHGQWSKYLTMASDILESAPWSKWLLCGQTSRLDQRSTILTIENLYFIHGHGQNFPMIYSPVQPSPCNVLSPLSNHIHSELFPRSDLSYSINFRRINLIHSDLSQRSSFSSAPTFQGVTSSTATYL